MIISRAATGLDVRWHEAAWGAAMGLPRGNLPIPTKPS
jgi:hypothetical protein